MILNPGFDRPKLYQSYTKAIPELYQSYIRSIPIDHSRCGSHASITPWAMRIKINFSNGRIRKFPAKAEESDQKWKKAEVCGKIGTAIWLDLCCTLMFVLLRNEGLFRVCGEATVSILATKLSITEGTTHATLVAMGRPMFLKRTRIRWSMPAKVPS